MKAAILVLLIASVSTIACSSTPASPGNDDANDEHVDGGASDATGGVTDGASPVVCAASGFAATGATWGIPYPTKSVGSGLHEVIDLDGDGRPDFVEEFPDSTGADPSIGMIQWLVFNNTGSGFAATGVSWRIPYVTQISGANLHALVDLDGDGRPDFVQLAPESTSTDPAIGVNRWLVFKNTGSGFAAPGTPWAIPYATTDIATGRHEVIDLDGDGRPDFVEEFPDSTGADPSIGMTHWLVFNNTGSGFAATGASWRIPYVTQISGANLHALVDLDGDGRPDFVQLAPESTSTDPAIGVSRWLVFKNTGSGFAATGTPWAIPYATTDIATGRHEVIDLDGDGRPDFVEEFPDSTGADPSIGTSRWLMFGNSGAAFAAIGAAWSIPYATQIAGANLHAVLDLDGDGHVDFVQLAPESTSTDPAIGVGEWKSFVGTCAGP